MASDAYVAFRESKHVVRCIDGGNGLLRHVPNWSDQQAIARLARFADSSVPQPITAMRDESICSALASSHRARTFAETNH